MHNRRHERPLGASRPRNRRQQVLHEIVEAYIATGEPVASRTIARRRADGLSPASIRNVMQDLVEEGFLVQPHTSAGRVPTGKAFRSYVNSISMRRLVTAEIDRLRAEMSHMDTVGQRIAFTSRHLMEQTRGMGIAAAIPSANPALDHIELIPLPDARVVMTLVTADGQVRDRIVSLEQRLSAEELTSIRNYINRNFEGWTMERIRRELAARLDRAEATYDLVLSKLNMLYSKGLLDLEASAELRMEGAGNLVVLDLHLTREKLQELFHALEEKKRVLALLDRFLEAPAGEIGVHVGLGEVHPAMQELAMIGLPVEMNGGLSAVIAVLGPMRMNYGRVMSTVRNLGEAIVSS